MPLLRSTFVSLLCLGLCACGGASKLPISEGMGLEPQLPPPTKTLIPTVNIAPATGWPVNGQPVPAAGLQVQKFADTLDHPRWLHVLPNGDVLVAETNAPPRPEDGKGLKAKAMQFVMKRAGAGTPSANRITLLRDADGDGMAEIRSVFVEGLYSPFGMALVGNTFYVANADSLMRFPYEAGAQKIAAPGEKLADLPGGPRNHHWTKGLIADKSGGKLYVSVGSNSNIAEHGMEAEKDRAAILEITAATGQQRVYAYGLRNPVGMAWEPKGGALWVAVNERDELGNDLVPDYITSVQHGGFYGWPYSYFGQHLDERMKPPRPDLVAVAIVPDYALGAHTASLGLSAAQGNALPPAFQNGMFVGQHGSWNRKPRSGYKVIFVPFENGKPAGAALEVLTGFVDGEGKAMGRPVGVAIDKQGALLVADDVGNVVWRVTAAASAAAKGAAADRPE